MKTILKTISFFLLIFKFTFSQEYYKIKLFEYSTPTSDEFGLVYYKDGYVYCSNVPRQITVNYVSKDNRPLFDVYYVQKKENGKLGSAVLFSETINSKYHDGPVSFNARFDTIYFSRNEKLSHKKKGKDTTGAKLRIFFAEFNDSIWTNIKSFKYNKPEYNVCHPSLSADGKYLYFASDMPGGLGESDIWVCKREKDKWTEPQNLGPVINTPGDEMFPYIHPSGRLYFSSNKHNSKGGLDIFYSLKKDNKWLQTIQLDKPFNTEYDDFAFIADSIFQTGFFSSNRNGTDDIYYFESTIPYFSDCDSLKENNFCFIFFEKSSPATDTLPFLYIWDFGDGTKARGNEVEHCFKDTGLYIVKLNVIDSLADTIYDNKATYIMNIQLVQQPYINSTDTSQINKKIKFDAIKNTYLKNFEIDNYYWDFGDGEKAVGPKVKHKYILPGTYKVTLGVTSRPDENKNIKKACVYKKIVITE